MHVFDQVADAATKVKDQTRSQCYIFDSARDELFELHEEVLRKELGFSAGSDGVLGESVDVILCLIDLMQRHDPNFTKEDFDALCAKKLNKWVDKY